MKANTNMIRENLNIARVFDYMGINDSYLLVPCIMYRKERMWKYKYMLAVQYDVNPYAVCKVYPSLSLCVNMFRLEQVRW